MVKFKNEYIEFVLNKRDIFMGLKEKSFPSNISYWINKGIEKVIADSETYGAEKAKIIDKYASKDEKGELIITENNMIAIPAENIEAFNGEMSNLLNIELEYNDLKQIEVDFESETMPNLSGIEYDIIKPFVIDITQKM